MPAFGNQLGRSLSDYGRDILASLRFSASTVLVVALTIVCGLAVSPTLSIYVNQQRELAELRESVRLANERVAQADQDRAKWFDPQYVRAQARGRLFYVMPGETQLSVIDDVAITEDAPELMAPRLTVAEGDWLRGLFASTLVAGLTDAPPAQLNLSQTAESQVEVQP